MRNYVKRNYVKCGVCGRRIYDSDGECQYCLDHLYVYIDGAEQLNYL